MQSVVILFDKSLAISEGDFEIFKKENYHIDDGTYHEFWKDVSAFLISDSSRNAEMAIFFKELRVENKKYYKIERIKHRMYRELIVSRDFNQTQNEVIKIIIKAFSLLDNIIEKRTVSQEFDNNTDSYYYIIYDEKNHKYDKIVGFDGRVNYSQFLTQLEYLFGFCDD